MVSCGGGVGRQRVHPLPEIETELPSPCPDRTIPYKKNERNYESLRLFMISTNLYWKPSGTFILY